MLVSASRVYDQSRINRVQLTMEDVRVVYGGRVAHRNKGMKE
jgi:hypothetical protein